MFRSGVSADARGTGVTDRVRRARQGGAPNAQRPNRRPRDRPRRATWPAGAPGGRHRASRLPSCAEDLQPAPSRPVSCHRAPRARLRAARIGPLGLKPASFAATPGSGVGLAPRRAPPRLVARRRTAPRHAGHVAQARVMPEQQSDRAGARPVGIGRLRKQDIGPHHPPPVPEYRRPRHAMRAQAGIGGPGPGKSSIPTGGMRWRREDCLGRLR